MNELNTRIEPIEDIFSLLAKTKLLKVVSNCVTNSVKETKSEFRTNADKINIKFEKIRINRDCSDSSVIFEDEEKIELFKVKLFRMQPLFEMPTTSICLQIDNKSIEDPLLIEKLLNNSGFDKILNTINSQLKENLQALEDQEKLVALNAKTPSQKVDDVLAKIGKIRPSSETFVDNKPKLS